MIKINPLPPLEFLNECFELDSSLEGGLRWKERPRSHFKTDKTHRHFNLTLAGKSSGSLQTKTRNKYYTVNFSYFGKQVVVKNHRIIYAMYNQKIDIENFCIDHKDGNTINNLPDNLRLATNMENATNRKVGIRSKSGCLGVTWHNDKKKWQSSIRINGKDYYLGSFVCLDDAITARKNAEKKSRNFYFQGIPDHERVCLSELPSLKERDIDLFSFEKISKLVQDMPLNKIAEIYNVRPQRIRLYCIRNNIPRPKKGFWNFVHNKKLD